MDKSYACGVKHLEGVQADSIEIQKNYPVVRSTFEIEGSCSYPTRDFVTTEDNLCFSLLVAPSPAGTICESLT